MAADKEAFLLDFVYTFLLQFLFTVFRKLPRKVQSTYNIRTFLKPPYDEARYFCNVFDAPTLLPFSYFWFYKFTLENVRCILIPPKTKVTYSSRCPNYGRFCPEVCLFLLRSIRASFPCKSRHLWKRSVYLERDLPITDRAKIESKVSLKINHKYERIICQPLI